MSCETVTVKYVQVFKPEKHQINDLITLKTPNPECPSCNAKTLHTKERWKAFHPLAGTGHIKGVNP